MSLTADELTTAITMAPPRLQTMIEALLQAQETIQNYNVGKVELAYAHAQVKMSLMVSLGCHKVRVDEPGAMIP